MKKVLSVISVFLFATSSMMAQEAKQWTLQECIQYALDHNIQVKQQQNTTRQQKIQLDDNKGNHLPTVDASIDQNFSFGRGLTAQNTYENTNTSRTSFQLGASVPLFMGGKIVNAVKLSQLNLDASLADLERAQDDIRTQVAKAYVQILYDMEVSDVAKRQIAIDSMQVYRLERMMEAGKVSQAEVSQQKATLAQSRLTATNADNNYRLSLLALSQLLELPTPEGFSIVKPDVAAITPLSGNEGSIVAPDVIYAEALGVKPQIKAEQLRLKATDFNIKIARADYMPTLSFSAGLGTNYYKTSGFEADGFGKQLKNNFGQ
ncbi:MAG: TolC family protein, partial [Prevotella sp.]|nr:TolC family protein [Prevotella sp.]